MSVQTNVNENPRDSNPYVPPGQTQTITNDPQNNKVKQAGGGVSSGGATVILNTDSVIQSTADSGGIPGARTGLADNASDAARFARSGTPQLPGPNLDVDAPDFSQLAMGGLDSIARAFANLSSALGTNPSTPAAPSALASSVDAPLGASADSPTTAAATATQVLTNTGVLVDPLTDAELTQVSQLVSQDPATITLYLNTLGLTPAQVSTMATAMSLANKGGDGVPGLDSSDLSIIMTALANILGMTPEQVAGLRGAAEKIQSLNEKVQANMHSTDPVVVGRVLQAQVDTTALTTPEKNMMQSYLTLLAAALAFMAEIQCTITQLEGKIKMAYMDAKAETAKQATAVAIETAKKNTDAIQSNVESQIAAIEAAKKAKLWKWLGPVITGLVCIVAVAAIVGTAGAATAPAIAGVSAAVAATTVTATTVSLVVVTVLMTVIAILDQTTDFTDKIADACNVPKDSAARQSFKAAFHMLIAIILVIATAGLATPAAAASVAAQEAASGATTTAATITTQATIKTLSSLNTMLMMMIIQPLFTSGLVTTGFSELYLVGKKPANADQQRDAMIFSTCMTIVAMIVVTAGVGKASSAYQQSAANAAAGGLADDAANAGASAATRGRSVSLVEDAPVTRERGSVALVEEGAENSGVAATAAEAGASGAANTATVASEAEQAAKSMTERFLETVQKNIITQFQKEIQILEQLLKLIQGATQAAAAYGQYEAQSAQAKASDEQAGLTREIGKLNAALTFLTSQLPEFDKTTVAFDKDIEKFAEQVTNFFDSVIAFIKAAQHASTQLRNSV